ncbi:VOC family protein [Bacillus velezensis]|uniref:VOC family protein n=1 Tax=Bacillus TaxID=1386 RepID=UPI001427FF8A|nr:MULTISPECIES: VOC family protein [Bacillus amyloliquefaciens group]MCP1458195.1 catechol 2,3-dioxygenase [Bacillus amyloliquefaciens]MEC1701752.1 VOC family protein [Bacillus velezensis]QIR32157.1 Catechol-2,3-dioxygenase [Bacillus velezensis]
MTGIHQDTAIGYVKLTIKNMERSLGFYRNVIGLQVISQTDRSARLSADGKRVLLVLEENPSAVVLPERSVTGLYHFAILLPDRKELGIALARLIENGIALGQGDHAVSEALYLSDPDGNGIEIYADRPRSTWQRDAEGNYVMQTAPVDVDGLLEEAGAERKSRLPEGTVIGHIHLHVTDLQEAKAFYTDILGFDIVGNYARMSALFVSAGGYHHHIGLNIWAGKHAPPKPGNASGLDYYTIALPHQKELSRVTKALTDAGFEIEEKEEGVFVKDPVSGADIAFTL